MIYSCKSSYLSNIIAGGNKYVIYKASPNTKQLYISFLQKNTDKEIMMIGDGSNDVSAIVQANIGIGIKMSKILQK